MAARRPSVETLVAQALHFIERESGAVVPPLQPSTTFARGPDHELLGDFTYSRDSNPTGEQVEGVLAAIEDGEAALLFSSGMAAFSSFFDTLESGAHVVAPSVMYHGGRVRLEQLSARGALDLTLFDADDPSALAKAVRPGRTAVVWIESYVNPTWTVIDIAEAARVAHEAGARLAVDSTVTPPVALRPLDLGADIVFHSVTKYLNGHSDLTGGVLITKSRDGHWADIANARKLMGGVMGAFEAWLLLRGMRTLAVRYARASQSALRIAEHFSSHAKMDKVLYPGLPEHAGHTVSAGQLASNRSEALFGGMLSLLVLGGAEEAITVASNLETIVTATSLGGVETLIEHRLTVEGPQSIVPANLLRLSVGLEDADDLIADLEAALSKI